MADHRQGHSNYHNMRLINHRNPIQPPPYTSHPPPPSARALSNKRNDAHDMQRNDMQQPYYPSPQFPCPPGPHSAQNAVPRSHPEAPPGLPPYDLRPGFEQRLGFDQSQRSAHFKCDLSNSAMPCGMAEMHPEMDMHPPFGETDGGATTRIPITSNMTSNEVGAPRKFGSAVGCRKSDSRLPNDFVSREGRSLSDEQPKFVARRSSVPSSFHDLYLRQIGVNESEQGGNLLLLELVAHLQAIMAEVVPHSKARVHGGIISTAQIKSAPLELSWEVPNDASEPLRHLANALRRQQPTPLKYLFRVGVPSTPLRSLIVTDLISNVTCEITLNNHWSLFFSESLARYLSAHRAIQLGTQTIIHWAAKCGLCIPPPTPADTTTKEIPSKASHANVSAVLVLWLRYLIERFPQLPTVSELILDGPSVASLDVPNLSVEELLVRFFEFYQSVDFSKSVISIRAGSPSLCRYERADTRSVGVASIVVVDPIIDRNLAGNWTASDLTRFLAEFQKLPWRVDSPNWNPEASIQTFLQDSSAISDWLVFCMSCPSSSPQQLELFEVPPNELSRRQSAQNFPTNFPTSQNFLSGQNYLSQGFPTSSVSSLALQAQSEKTTSSDELLAEIASLRLVQQIMAEKLRFLRNDLWWLERKSSTKRERTESTLSSNGLHWTSSHFRSSWVCENNPPNPSTNTSANPSVIPPTNPRNAEHRNSESTNIPFPTPVNPPPSINPTNINPTNMNPPNGKFSKDLMPCARDFVPSSTKTECSYRTGSFDTRSSSPITHTSVPTTAGSTPPVPTDSPSLNNASSGRLNDAVSLLLELTDLPNEWIANLSEQQNSEPNKNDVTPSAEVLAGLVAKHLGRNWDWGSSPQLQMLMTEAMREQGAIETWGRVRDTPFFSPDTQIILTPSRSTAWSSYICSTTGPALLTIVPQQKCQHLLMRVAWKGPEGTVTVGTIGMPHQTLDDQKLEVTAPRYAQCEAPGTIELDLRSGQLRLLDDNFHPSSVLLDGIEECERMNGFKVDEFNNTNSSNLSNPSDLSKQSNLSVDGFHGFLPLLKLNASAGELTIMFRAGGATS